MLHSEPEDTSAVFNGRHPPSHAQLDGGVQIRWLDDLVEACPPTSPRLLPLQA